MFKHYLHFLANKNVTLLKADNLVIEEFLLSLKGVAALPFRDDPLGQTRPGDESEVVQVSASKITVRRYVQLLGETYEYLADVCSLKTNPMIPLLAVYAKPEAAPVISFLTAGQEVAFREYVKALPTESWRESRDAAILALLLGTGVTVAEASALQLPDVRVDDFVPVVEVAENGPVPVHLTPILEFAVPSIQAWLIRRRSENFAGKVFFPATSAGQPLDTSRIYLTVRKALDAIGSTGKHRGPATLRNTFARRHLHEGVDQEQIKAWMGLATDRTINKLKSTMLAKGGSSLA